MGKFNAIEYATSIRLGFDVTPWWETSDLVKAVQAGAILPYKYSGSLDRERVIAELAMDRKYSNVPSAALVKLTLDEALAYTGPTTMIGDDIYRVVVAEQYGMVVDHHDMKVTYAGGKGYTPHDLKLWLMDTMPGMELATAGLLPDSTAWAQFRAPEAASTIILPTELKYLAATATNGKSQSRFKIVATTVLCDNTWDCAMGEKSEEVKVKHTRMSATKVDSEQGRIDVLFGTAARLDAEYERLMNVTVRDQDFVASTKRYMGERPTDEGRSQTMYDNKFDSIVQTWKHDDRVVPTKGTALGAFQAFDTWRQHVASVKGTDRVIRQTLDFIGDDGIKADTLFMTNVAAIVGKQAMPAWCN